MAIRHLLQIMPGSPEIVDKTLREYQDWRIVGFNVTQGGLGGYPTTAWILLEADENVAERPLRALEGLVGR